MEKILMNLENLNEHYDFIQSLFYQYKYNYIHSEFFASATFQYLTVNNHSMWTRLNKY